MIISGANELQRNKEHLDSLNVFPVPDGDTGTNMSLTLLSAANEVYKLNTPNASDIAKAASSGSLRGARGNSGVILSQIFRGLAKGMEHKALLSTEDLANAFVQGAETAYKAVMKPKEGTILTVIRKISEKAVDCAIETDDIEEYFKEIISYGYEVLDKTMEMLPELKQAGVVDAGGKGFLIILEGFASAIKNHGEIEIIQPTKEQKAQPQNMNFAATSNADIKFAYCTEFFINVKKVSEDRDDKLKKFLELQGDSIVVVSDEDIIKIHVHTNNPGKVLDFALKIGSLDNIKIENMKTQHTNIIDFVAEKELQQKEEIIEPSEFKETGFVSVVTGDGFIELFKGLGADYVIEGGQSMNPSTDDFIDAISNVNANNIIILPNNKNIILAAKQAKSLCKNKNIIVIETKTIPQGISALINFPPSGSIDYSVELMNESIKNVKTGQVTYAVRETVFDGKEIKEGNVISLLESKIEFVGENALEAAKSLIDLMVEDDEGVVSIYYGCDVSKSEADALGEYVSEKYEDCEVEVYKGNQPLYYYIISVE